MGQHWREAVAACTLRASVQARCARAVDRVQSLHHRAAALARRELVQSLADNGYLVVTWANQHYTDFALTWVHHVEQVRPCRPRGRGVGGPAARQPRRRRPGAAARRRAGAAGATLVATGAGACAKRRAWHAAARTWRPRAHTSHPSHPQVGIKGYMVGAMDDEILVKLAKRKIHTFSMKSGA